MLRKITLPVMLLAGSLAFATTPDSRISAASCGGVGQVLCKTNTSCVSIIFYSQCTTTYDYYPLSIL